MYTIFIVALFTIARTSKQPLCPSTEWMDKEDVVHLYNGILPGHKKKHIWVIPMRWMHLEPIIQSEVSQKEKDKYHILMHIYGI